MFRTVFQEVEKNCIAMKPAMLVIAVAVVIGLITATVYMVSNKKEGYSSHFIVGLVMLPPIVAAVILLVDSDMARALSMAGAFALVRFRSAPGSAKDIVSVFFAMTAGLACGLGFVTFAFVYTVVILGVMMALSFTGFGERKEGVRQLKITIPDNLNYTEVFDGILQEYTQEYKLCRVKTTNMGTLFELTYRIIMKKDAGEKNFIDELRTRNGNLDIVLGIPETNTGSLN